MESRIAKSQTDSRDTKGILESNSLKFCFKNPAFEVNIDLCGPLTETLNGNKYVGIAVCALTKYVEAQGNIEIKNFI